jgi:NodT family efflux transporter outer membrane factor (OMF) lipoprotein
VSSAPWPRLWPILFFTGCLSVGPDYTPPRENSPDSWQDLSGIQREKELDPAVLARFWEQTNDPALSSLIRLAVANNRTLKQAADRLVAARANRGLAYTAFLPKAEISGRVSEDQKKTRTQYHAESGTDLTTAILEKEEAERVRSSRATTRALGLDASWEIDVFGGTRRAVEAADADMHAARAAYRDALVSLVGEVALVYVELRTQERRLSIAEENLKAQQSSLELAVFRVQAGLADALDEEQAKLSIEQTKSQIPSLRTGILKARYALAALLGHAPESFPPEVAALLEARGLPSIPEKLVVDMPADALRRRPDIRRAERKLAAETARIGVQTSELYPKLTLPGSLSYSASSGTETGIASIGLRVNWGIFNAPAIRQRIDIQKATQSEAFHAYEQALLAALQEISGALVAFSQEQERRVSLAAAARHAEQSALLTRLKYQTGLVAFSDVLAAERTLLNSQDSLAVSEGELIADFVRLYKALGGGWQSFDPEE